MKHSSIPPEILTRCRILRQNTTGPEQLLWSLLRNRVFGGAKFRRQHPAGKYILDFYCHEAHLAIELDGSGHLEDHQTDHDQQRTTELESLGIRVLRFWNHEVSNQTEEVLSVIWETLFPQNVYPGDHQDE